MEAKIDENNDDIENTSKQESKKIKTIKTKIDIIVRQTDYDNDFALKKLIEFDYNIENVIKDYMGVKPKLEKKYTINQQIYKEIRTMMDNASLEYEKKKLG